MWSFRSGQGDMCFALVLFGHVGTDIAARPDDDGHDNVVPDDVVHDQEAIHDDAVHEEAVPNNLAGYYLKDGSHLQYISTDPKTIQNPLPDIRLSILSFLCFLL